MGGISYLDDKTLHKTVAFRVYSTPATDPTRLFMRLMNHAAKSLKESPRVSFDIFGKQAGPVNLVNEARQNLELHASIDCARLLLKNIHSNIVEPNLVVVSLNKMDQRTPLEHADKWAEKCPELGTFFKNHLTTHQKRLDYKRNHPEKFIPLELRPDPAPYGTGHRQHYRP